MHQKNTPNSPQATAALPVPSRRKANLAVFLLAVLLAPSVGSCATFNWPSPPNWAATGPASGTSETVDYGYNAQGSLRATVFNSGMTYNATYPSVQTYNGFQGANGGTGIATQNSLILYATAAATTASYSQVTIYFQYTGGANNVSFNLWDVDFGGNTTWIDKITNITATTTTNAIINPTNVTGSTANQVTGDATVGWTVTGTAGSGNNSNAGNVSVTFAPATAITSLTFQWSNAATTTRTNQYIGLSPINFTGIGTAFPEVGSATAALALCGGLAAAGRFRQRRTVPAMSGV